MTTTVCVTTNGCVKPLTGVDPSLLIGLGPTNRGTKENKIQLPNTPIAKAPNTGMTEEGLGVFTVVDGLSVTTDQLPDEGFANGAFGLSSKTLLTSLGNSSRRSKYLTSSLANSDFVLPKFSHTRSCHV